MNNGQKGALWAAVAHFRAGRWAEAKNLCAKTLSAEPRNVMALHLLGILHCQEGDVAKGAELIGKAVRLRPDNPVAQYDLGQTQFAQGRLEDAAAAFGQALALKPDFAEAHNSLGNTRKNQGRLADAVTAYRHAVEVNPDFPEAHNNLGNALQELGKLDQAIASYHRALSIKPDYAEAQYNLGIALKNLGKLDQAIASYHRALSIKPDYAEAYRHLASVKNFSEYDNDIKIMEDAYAMPGLGDQQRMHLAFGLGKSFEDLGQYEKAFGFYLTGNAIKRGTYEFSIESVEKNFEHLKKVFVRDFFDRHQGAGWPDETPIFILGMPRSGTTLVEQILASHPKVHGAGEVDHLHRIVASYFTEIDDARFAESLCQASTGDFLGAGGEYINKIRECADSAEFITDKMLNFRLIGMIKLMLPNAKIIHCRRDSLDTCLSIFKHYFSVDGHYYAYDLDELGRYYNLYRDLMNHWYSVLPDFIYDIHYEDVVADQEKQSRALLAYCGLEWDDACLEFYRTDRPIFTASAAQIRRPIYTDSVRSWERYENWLAPLLDELANQ